MKTAIIIVRYGAEGAFRACLASVRGFTSALVPVITYNNRPKNENLGALWNRLIRRLGPDVTIFVLLNPDTVVSPRWLAGLIGGIDAGHAVVGPLTNRCGFPRQVRPRAAGKPGYVEVQALSGFCVAIDRAAFEAIGGFREDFPLYGQDSDLFMRLRRKSNTLAIAQHVFVRHHGSASGREAQRKGEMLIAHARRRGAAKYKQAVAEERKLRPRVLGLVRAGVGQQESENSLREAGMDEVHILPRGKLRAFIKSRERFFEAAISLDAGETARLTKAQALTVASNGGDESVVRLPFRRGDA